MKDRTRFFASCRNRIAMVVLGILIGQAILYGPSLIGLKVMLPLGTLARPSVYLPQTPEARGVVAHNPVLSDLVLFQEPERLFVNSELRAGRWPLWTPYRFGGDPMFPMSYSPAWWPAYLIASPVVLAWVQMLVALIAGLGAYVFCQMTLRVRFWPAAIVAWVYPITGAYVLWQGFWLPAVMCWLGWVLAAVDHAIRHPRGLGGPSLALLTMLVIVSGMLDIAGQLLLASGMYAIWCFIDEYGFRLPRFLAIRTVVLGWALGIAASAFILVPLLNYVQTGSRMNARAGGVEERPPIGLSTLPQLVFPDIYGSMQAGSYRIGDVILQESSAQGYAGLLATLVLAPLAWQSRKHRSINIFWLVLSFITLSWTLNVPVMVQLLRLPVLNMMSHNRFVFVTSFAVLALAAVGLDILWRGRVHRQWWFVLPAIVLAALCFWSAYRSTLVPQLIAGRITGLIDANIQLPDISDQLDPKAVLRSGVQTCITASLLAGLGVAAWGWLSIQKKPSLWTAPAMSCLLLLEMVYSGYGRAPQRRWALYFPRLPLLEQIAHASSGRFIGFGCLPPNIGQMIGLRDIRGYDGIDPQRMTELLHIASDDRYGLPNQSHAQTQNMVPKLFMDQNGHLHVHAILDMLNVKYVIVQGRPPPQVSPDLVDVDYWAFVNRDALPRVFVPTHVEVAANRQERLAKLSADNLDARQIAYVEQAVNLPGPCRGEAAIIDEVPTRVTVWLTMQTTGLVVLSDRWDKGWNAYLDGVKVPVLRVNHAVRGVIASPNSKKLEFRYEPASLRWGAVVSTVATLAWLGWIGIVRKSARIRYY